MIFLFLLVSFSFGFECPIIKKNEKIKPNKPVFLDDVGFYRYLKNNVNFKEIANSCKKGNNFAFCYKIDNQVVFFKLDKKKNKNIFNNEELIEKILDKENGKINNSLKEIKEMNKLSGNIEIPCTGNN